LTWNTERGARRGFTLIELMVSIGILLVLGVMIITFLRGALTMTRTGTARGQQFETAQTVLRLAEEDFSQVLGLPAHPDGPTEDLAFLLMHDPFGRQVICITRAWGEEQSTLAGYDAGRGAPGQSSDPGVPQPTYGVDYSGRYDTRMRASHGNIEVVYLLEPTRDGTKLYRAERSPPGAGGLVDKVSGWCSVTGETAPMAEMLNPASPYALDGQPLWDNFEMVADNVLAFSVECWDDSGVTTTWDQGPSGPVTTWSITQRRLDGKYALPRAIRLNLVVAADEPLRAETTLTGDIATSDTGVYVEESDRFPDQRSPSAYLRVDGEMIAYGSRAGRTFGSCVRGALGSQAQKHTSGARVMAGELFQRVIQMPVTR
jgi:prepilin-type N-terminal cleavage/methylation domain-containing protein